MCIGAGALGISDETGVSSEEIAVRSFRHTLFWPLSLDRGAGLDEPRTSIGEAVDRFAAETLDPSLGDGPWKRAESLLHHLRAEPGLGAAKALERTANAYEEMVYYHDFVQRILFTAEPDDEHPPLRLYTRDDVVGAEITFRPAWDAKPRSLTVAVERVNLYLVRTGVAILAVEIAWPGDRPGETLNLHDLQGFLDAFRRAYPHWLTVKTAEKAEEAEATETKEATPVLDLPHQCVDQVVWTTADGALPSQPTKADAAAVPGLVARIEAGGPGDALFPPIFSHVRMLLPPKLLLVGGGDAAVWRQVADERMPCTTHIVLEPAGTAQETIARVRTQDWHRLCFVDSGGKVPAYDLNFVAAAGFATRNAYDRYVHLGTRYFFSGYSFTGVGVGARQGDFPYFETVVCMHFRRHYHQMALLAVLEFASLLGISSRITRAVERLSRERGAGGRARLDPGVPDPARARAEEDFAARMSTIESDFLQYVHRFRFTGISTQLQAGELFGRWRETMGLTGLYDDLKDEIERANDYLEARAGARQAEASTNLAVLATIGVAVGVPLAFFGMGVLALDGALEGVSRERGPVAAGLMQLGIVSIGFAVSFLAGHLGVRRLMSPEQRARREPAWLLGVLQNGSLAALVVGLVLIAGAFSGT